VLEQVGRTAALVGVLAATDVVEVVLVAQWLAERALVQPPADAAPHAAALEHQQVAAVGVDVHQVGVEGAHAKDHAGTPRQTISLPTCSIVGAITMLSSGSKPAVRASAHERRAVTGRKANQIDRGRARAVRRDA
jgi:hypothetical protein